MPAQVTSKQIARKFPGANLSALPTSNPGGGKPWLHGSGSIVVGAFTGGGNFLPLAGGTISGEVFIASGGGLYLYDASAEADVPISVDDGYLLVGGTPLLSNDSTLDASKLGVGTVPDARLSSNIARYNLAGTFTILQIACASSSSTKALIAKAGGASATVPIFEVQDSTGNAYAHIWQYTSNAQIGVLGPSGAVGIGFTQSTTARPSIGLAPGDANTCYFSNGTNIGGFRLRSDTTMGGLISYAGLHLTQSGGSSTLYGSIWVTSGNVFQFRNYGTSTPSVLDCGAINAPTALTGHRLGYFGSIDSVTMGWPGTSFGTFQAGASGSYSFAGGGSVLTAAYIDAALRPFTVAGLPLASASDGKECRVTDSTLAMTSANYGSTPSGGGSNKVRLFSNGTSWLLA